MPPDDQLPPNQPLLEFPEKIYCPQCRQNYITRMLHTRCNTLLTDIQLICPRCRRKLRKMRLKDWYDHYVHEQ